MKTKEERIMRKTKELETVDTVERERERERVTLYSTWNPSTRPHTNVLVNNKKNIKKARNSITMSVLKIDTG